MNAAVDICDVCGTAPAVAWLGPDVHACASCAAVDAEIETAVSPRINDTVRIKATGVRARVLDIAADPDRDVVYLVGVHNVAAWKIADEIEIIDA